ncbi:putative zinc finger/helix-turn-helix YgiT family protein [Collimonas sp. PA-H2]|uniref:type II TA system antitoxin MqsA family protein n=1 Tax=Collimonas sp. PA-H2 TaxID=1881062 RepID=UPI000BF6E163|nr:type II TA system antitoxin MqsA family protein [Collimonas sp. PA-H2]PFH10575.1 putative zinc finger/helix-turn-helix YgiT family protein [Collimonas sp. PA-H2]
MNTSKRIACKYCDAGRMVEVSVDEHIKSGRAKLVVKGILQWQCDVCESVMTDAQQYTHNEKLVRDAENHKAGYITPAMLRDFREKYSLSQREAGRLIGAGKGAFGKYESGHHLSTPTAKLIRVALAVPEAARYLAVEEGVSISLPTLDDMWDENERPFSKVTLMLLNSNDSFIEAANMAEFRESESTWKTSRMMECA